MPAVIVLGDITDHGGEVIEASGVTETHGKYIARVGDRVACPKKGHGGAIILTGDHTMLIDGRAVAYDGCTTSCGARLMASQSVTMLDFGSDIARLATASPLATTCAPSHDEQVDLADQRFVLFDETSQAPLVNRLYRLHFRGETTEGRTDAQGRTTAVTGSLGEEVTLEVFAEHAQV